MCQARVLWPMIADTPFSIFRCGESLRRPNRKTDSVMRMAITATPESYSDFRTGKP